MPLDGTGYETAAGRRAGLIAALRREMPAGYTWDFGSAWTRDDCGTRGCALGLAITMWPELYPDSDSVADHIGISHGAAWRIFGRTPGCLWPAGRGDEVTPGMVADALSKVRKRA